MLWTLLASAALAFPQQVDTTFAVEPGTRLQVNNHSGRIDVRAWGRNELRIETGGTRRVSITRGTRVVRVAQIMRHGPTDIGLRITAPAWMALDLTGVETAITVTGSQAAITAESVDGDIVLQGGRGLVVLHAVDGDVTVEGLSGRLEVNAIDGAVRVSRVTGEISIEAVDGDITLDDITSSVVSASTIDGDIVYRGTVQDGGRYKLTSHDGDVTFAATGSLNATIAVATFSGNFESEIPVTITRSKGGGQHFTFVLGSGSARVALESFDGTIRLRGARR